MKEAYKSAGITLSKNLTKRNKDQQKRDVIRYIKNNSKCTISDIHNNVKVNVIRVFGSIKKAYKSSGKEYPKKEITSGVINPEVIERCNNYEKKIIELLSEIGEINPKVRTPVGIIDCLFKTKDMVFVVEIKDYRGKNNITMFELKQLMRYMYYLGINNGLLICPKES